MVWLGLSACFMRIVRYRRVVGLQAGQVGGFTCVIMGGGCCSSSCVELVGIVVVVLGVVAFLGYLISFSVCFFELSRMVIPDLARSRYSGWVPAANALSLSKMVHVRHGQLLLLPVGWYWSCVAFYAIFCTGM